MITVVSARLPRREPGAETTVGRDRRSPQARALYRWLSAVALAAVALSTSACAIRYYDPETGAEHIWGLGHLVSKTSAPADGRIAIIRGSEIVGIGVDVSPDSHSLAIGYSRERRVDIVQSNAVVSTRDPDDLLRLDLAKSADTGPR